MSEVRHKITRIGGNYQVQKHFISEHTKQVHWVTKRFKNNPGHMIGPVKSYERLYKAIEDIRKEPDGKLSQIEITDAVRNYLNKIGFKDSDIKLMLKNNGELKSNEFTAIS